MAEETTPPENTPNPPGSLPVLEGKETDDKPLLTDLDRADQIAQMQKRENDRHEALILKQEALEARKIIGGSAEAGQETKPVDKELKKKKDAAEFFKGTSLEKDILKDVKD